MDNRNTNAENIGESGNAAQENYKCKHSAKLIVRCGMLENRLDWLNRIMRDEYPENQTRVMRLIIKTRKKLLIIERLLSRAYRT